MSQKDYRASHAGKGSFAEGYDEALFTPGFFDELVWQREAKILDEVIEKKLWQDAKSLFQEKAQEDSGITPTYRVLDEEGPDHDKIFEVGLYIDQELISNGRGPSKQEAEQEAARAGLAKKRWIE